MKVKTKYLKSSKWNEREGGLVKQPPPPVNRHLFSSIVKYIYKCFLFFVFFSVTIGTGRWRHLSAANPWRFPSLLKCKFFFSAASLVGLDRLKIWINGVTRPWNLFCAATADDSHRSAFYFLKQIGNKRRKTLLAGDVLVV